MLNAFDSPKFSSGRGRRGRIKPQLLLLVSGCNEGIYHHTLFIVL